MQGGSDRGRKKEQEWRNVKGRSGNCNEGDEANGNSIEEEVF